MAFNLCNSISLGVDQPIPAPSITKVGEKLDLNVMLQRAQMGILDLTAYQRSKNCDLRDLDVNEKNVEALLDRPSSVLDRTFGFCREDGASEVASNFGIARQNYKPKKSDPPKSDPPKNDPPE